jgi:hypothetical protein
MTKDFLMRWPPAALVVAFLLLDLGHGAQAGQPATSERLLPRETIAFAKIPNATEFRRRWNQSSFGAIQRDPAFAPFVADLERQLDARTARIKRATGLGVKELWLSLKGEVAVALVHSHDNGFAVVGVVEAGEDETSAVRTMAALEAALALHGAVAVRLHASDVDVTSWSLGAEPDTLTFSCFRRGRHVVVGADLNTILTLAAKTRSDGRDSLAENPFYQYIMEQTRASSGDPAVQWFVDPIGGLRAAIDSNLQGNPGRELIAGLLKKAGIEKIKGIGGSIEFASAFADNITRTFGYVEPPADGLLDAFRLPATHQVPPAWITEDANFYLQVNWSGPRFYRAIAAFFDSYQGAGAFRTLVGSGRLPNSEVTFEECLNQMVGPVHVVANFPKSTGDLLKQPAIVAIRIADPKKAGEMLRSIATSAGAKLQSFGGTTTYTMRLGLPQSGPAIEVAMAVVEGTLMVSTNPRYLHSVLSSRGKKRTLAESHDFQQATGDFPEKTSMLTYQRQDRRFEGLYETIRAGKLQLSLYGGMMAGLALDFSKLPPAEAIRGYLQTSSSFIEPVERGFRMIEIGFRSTGASVRRSLNRATSRRYDPIGDRR